MTTDVGSVIIESERLAVEDFDISFAEDIPENLKVRADPEQLYRVIANLVRNARQAIVASKKSGEIAVVARDEEDAWFITVADTGPGLPPKAREHLFTPFQGGTRQGGSGLGLAISQELVRGHGGSLMLTQSDETGTTFEICLPRGDVAEN